ncbi:tail fiber protein [Escherichia coli]|uniref:tail fiber protein n=1 Tax=Escherichia coli TaxID=562 RepID=UPI0028774083|nr:tail fiber protein [Escherichia coli]
MNDVTVVTSVTYPSPESLALVADVQYHEPYLSAALNRKFRGIVDPGFYAGFLPKPGGGMNLLITSVDGDKTAGAASVDIGEFYQVTIQHRKDISLALNAGKKYAIVLKGRYLLGEDTYQVNTASHIHAAEFVARTYTDSYQLGDGELLVCTVNIPAGVSTITQEMIDTSERINRTIGIDISDSVTSTRSDVAASSLAVKKAYDLAKSKYTAQDASTTQKGLVQLSSATNSTSEVLAATPKAVKAAYDLANGKYTAQDATTTQKGIVQLSSDTNSTSETLAATPKAVKAAYDLAAGKAPSSHTHPWNQITGVPTASLTAKGITQLSSATNSTSEVLAATPKAVKSVKDLADTKAPIESPSLTGTPTAPTAAQGTNSTQIANTAFVKAAITALINGAPGTLDTLKEIAAAINNDPNFSTTINNALALKAPLASPALTGVPTAPTAAQGTNNTQIATTAYVRAAISALVGSSPEALDTLNELAAALGNDPNFATTMTNALAGKQPLDATLTALAALATGANKLPYFTGKDTVAQTDLTSVGRDILAKTSTLAVIQYLGLRELGTSGKKIPLLSTANTWSARQTFNGGITGALTGNADTATKIKTARTIGGVSFDGSANIDLPGVNKTGNQNTTGNAATATKLQTARTINGVSFDGSANITLSPANIGCPASPTGWLTTGNNGESITTAQLVTLLQNNGAFNTKAWIARCAWAYANSASIPDSETGCGIIPLAGAVIEVFSNNTNNYTIRITTATTTNVSGALTNAEFIYVSNGSSYSPGWRRAYNTKNKPTAADVGALPLSGGALTGGLTAAGEIISKSANGLRIAYGNYGFFIRNDGSNTYFMLTDSGNSLGTYNSLRPLIINNANGAVTIGNGLNVTGGINGSLNGNAATATKLQTARTIGGVSFDGSANINLPGVNIAGNQNTTGNAATATKLQTARTINGVSFDGSKNIELTAEDLNLQEFINKANNAVQRSGDILSGGLTFENDSILAWIRNTDWAKIGFKNDADSDTDSYMWFETGDNGNEYFKWRSKQSTTTKDLMNLKWDALSVLVKALFSSQVKISTVNALRIFNSSFGAIFRRSEECLHIIPTRENEGENGDIGPLRPFTLNLRTGRISMGHGLDVTGDIFANRFAINSSNGMWIQMRDNNAIFGRNIVKTDSAQALLRQDHADRKFMIGGLGNRQFGIYMINNSRTDNGTDGQAYMDNNGNWLCGSQVIPGNYGNFDTRYVKDVRLGSQQYYGVNNWQTWNFQCPSGHVLSGINVQDTGSNSADNIAGVYYRPVQKYINGTWYNVASV